MHYGFDSRGTPPFEVGVFLGGWDEVFDIGDESKGGDVEALEIFDALEDVCTLEGILKRMMIE